MQTLTDQNWLLSVGVFLPMLGVLVMLFIPRGEEALVKARRHRHRRRHAGHRHRHARQLQLRRVAEAAVLRRRRVDPGHPRQLHGRSRRHQPAALLPVDGRHVPRDDLLVGQHARRRQPEGVLHPDARAADGHGRHVRRPGPDPVLRVLRTRAAADVLHDRRVGRRAAAVRLAQVLPLHDVRLGVHARRLPRSVLPDGCGELRLPAPDRGRRRHRQGRAGLDLRRHVPRLRHQGADVPVPHVAARRPHPGADAGLGHPGRHPAEARHVRLRAHRHPDAAARVPSNGRR